MVSALKQTASIQPEIPLATCQPKQELQCNAISLRSAGIKFWL
jgi:hypothetical protein